MITAKQIAAGIEAMVEVISRTSGSETVAEARTRMLKAIYRAMLTAGPAIAAAPDEARCQRSVGADQHVAPNAAGQGGEPSAELSAPHSSEPAKPTVTGEMLWNCVGSMTAWAHASAQVRDVWNGRAARLDALIAEKSAAGFRAEPV